MDEASPSEEQRDLIREIAEAVVAERLVDEEIRKVIYEEVLAVAREKTPEIAEESVNQKFLARVLAIGFAGLIGTVGIVWVVATSVVEVAIERKIVALEEKREEVDRVLVESRTRLEVVVEQTKDVSAGLDRANQELKDLEVQKELVSDQIGQLSEEMKDLTEERIAKVASLAAKLDKNPTLEKTLAEIGSLRQLVGKLEVRSGKITSRLPVEIVLDDKNGRINNGLTIKSLRTGQPTAELGPTRFALMLDGEKNIFLDSGKDSGGTIRVDKVKMDNREIFGWVVPDSKNKYITIEANNERYVFSGDGRVHRYSLENGDWGSATYITK